jgi:hypothetical protein
VLFGENAVVHHTAGFTDPGFALEGKPGPKWYQMVWKGIANWRIRRAIIAYERRKNKVVAREMAAMRAWQRAHQHANGWTDIGYHRVIFPSGHVYEGRPWNTRGAHAYNGNHMPGYSFAGNFEVQQPTKQALGAFEIQRKDDGIKRWVGHYRVPGNSTACPGRNLKAALGA